MLQVDYTIHVSDLAMIGTGIVVTWRTIKWAVKLAGAMLIEQRDFNHKISAVVIGDKERPGLVTDVHELKREVYEPGGAIYRTKRAIEDIKLALARSGIDLRREEP